MESQRLMSTYRLLRDPILVPHNDENEETWCYTINDLRWWTLPWRNCVFMFDTSICHGSCSVTTFMLVNAPTTHRSISAPGTTPSSNFLLQFDRECWRLPCWWRWWRLSFPAVLLGIYKQSPAQEAYSRSGFRCAAFMFFVILLSAEPSGLAAVSVLR